MTKEAAEILAECSEAECNVRDDYSGRGMYGKVVHAVSFDSTDDLHTALLEAGFKLGEESNYDLLEELKGLGSDGMGLGIVVY
jgi:hypothetical protein